jgi:hypothetical protein
MIGIAVTVTPDTSSDVGLWVTSTRPDRPSDPFVFRKKGRCWRNLRLQPKSAFSRFARVHRPGLDGQERVDLARSPGRRRADRADRRRTLESPAVQLSPRNGKIPPRTDVPIHVPISRPCPSDVWDRREGRRPRAPCHIPGGRGRDSNTLFAELRPSLVASTG